MPTARAEQAPTTMIDRISSLLEAFDGSRQLTLAQIARRANLPRCIHCFCCQEFCPKGAMVVGRTALAKLLEKG